MVTTMSISMHSASVPVFRQMLSALSDLLQKGEAHALARGFDPAVLMQARLYPDMFALTRQVQIACDFAKGISARLAAVEPPSHPDTEQTFAELQARIASTRSFIDSLSPAAFEGAETREIVLRPGTPKEKRMDGHTYLLGYGLPQFFFHLTTAYALLRHNGVEVGKRDYMGSY
jgi:hypothetical protein